MTGTERLIAADQLNQGWTDLTVHGRMPTAADVAAVIAASRWTPKQVAVQPLTTAMHGHLGIALVASP